MWSEVFLAQAQSDWQVYEHLEKTTFPHCHALHYLQMTTEKLAKAYLLAGQTNTKIVRSTHHGLSRFFQLVSRNKGLQEEMGMTAKQLSAHVQRLLPLAHDIESLAPAIAGNSPNPEYPREAPLSVFYAPMNYEFAISKALRAPHGLNLIKLIRTILKKFYALHKA
jgi:hypothetical protein